MSVCCTREFANPVRIVVSGVVDSATVGDVAIAVSEALQRHFGVEVDIRSVEGWADDALRNLAACARLGAGVEILTGGRPRGAREQPTVRR